MAKRNIIVFGGSSGSFEAFKKIAAGLPKDLDASIFIVWHMSPDVGGILPHVLNRVGPIHASEARDGELVETNRIYVARPDHHLLLENSHVRVTRGPKENRFRPAVDPLFRSAAYAHGPRVIGVITSGALDDGTAGLWAVKQRGGFAIAQDPNDAEIASMPENAIREVNVDLVLPVSDIPEALATLSQEEISDALEGQMQDEAENKRTELEIRIAAEENALPFGIMNWGKLTPFTCPECSGVLARIKDGERPRFRCHTGHAFSADSLLSGLTENIEESLWSAIRGVDESIMLLNHIGDHFAEVNKGSLAAKFFQKANEAKQRNALIRRAVFDHELLTTDGIEQEPDVPVLPGEGDPGRDAAAGGRL
jgi:two-component system chemotaxis response regulator CheB